MSRSKLIFFTLSIFCLIPAFGAHPDSKKETDPEEIIIWDREEVIIFDVLDEVIDEGVVDMVETVLSAPDESEPDPTSLAVLDYLSAVYSTAGFYDSGYWGPPVEQLTLPVYKGPVEYSHPSEFQMPVYGVITSRFGWRKLFNRMHKGVDIALKTGDPVKVVLPGVVTLVSYDAKGYGNYVIVAHSDGLETRYAHLSQTLVKQGDKVSKGDVIGLGGSTGNSTGPHLHFESRRNGVALDPLTVFPEISAKAHPVR